MKIHETGIAPFLQTLHATAVREENHRLVQRLREAEDKIAAAVPLAAAAEVFLHRVERGEVRSVKTYEAFKSAMRIYKAAK